MEYFDSYWVCVLCGHRDSSGYGRCEGCGAQDMYEKIEYDIEKEFINEYELADED